MMINDQERGIPGPGGLWLIPAGKVPENERETPLLACYARKGID